MKVQRYFSPATTVDQLQEARRSLLTPYQAAQAAGARTDAYARIAFSLSQDLSQVYERQQKLNALEDERTKRVMEKQLQLSLAQTLNDPRWEKHTQPDGTPTPTAMREAWNETAQKLRDGFGRFNSERARSNFDEVYQLAEQAALLDIEKAVIQKREQIDADTLSGLEQIALQNKDYSYARQVIREQREKGYITDAQQKVALNEVDRQIKVDTRDEIVSGLYDALEQGEDQAEAYLENIRSNPQDDAQLQGVIMSSLNAVMANYEKSKQQENAWKQATAMREMADAIRLAEEGGIVDTDVLFQRQMELLDDPVQAMRGVLQIEDAVARGAQRNAGYAEFLLMANNDIPTLPDKDNRSYVDQFLMDAEQMGQAGFAPGDNPDKNVLQIKADVYRKFGYVGNADRTMLRAGVSSAEGLAEMAPLVQELTRDPLRQVDMGLTAPQEALYQSVIARHEAGMPLEEAAQFQLELMNVSDEEREHRATYWTKGERGVSLDQTEPLETGPERARKYYEEMLEDQNLVLSGIRFPRSQYTGIGVIPVWGEEEVPGLNDGSIESGMAARRYTAALKDGLMLYGNYEDARRHANTTWRRSHGYNNINGEWAVQFNGVDGDVSAVRKNLMTSLKNQEFTVMALGGGYRTLDGGSLDRERISFVDASKSDRGVTYSLYYNGAPMLNPETQDVKKVLIESSDLQSAYQDTQARTRRAELKKQIETKRAQIEEANRKLALGDDDYDFPDRVRGFLGGRPQLPADPSDVIRTGPAALERLEAELNSLDDAGLPSL